MGLYINGTILIDFLPPKRWAYPAVKFRETDKFVGQMSAFKFICGYCVKYEHVGTTDTASTYSSWADTKPYLCILRYFLLLDHKNICQYNT